MAGVAIGGMVGLVAMMAHPTCRWIQGSECCRVKTTERGMEDE